MLKIRSFVAGLVVGLVSASAVAAADSDALAAHVNTSGILHGYIVQDVDGTEVCRDPWVSLHLRDSFITCDDRPADEAAIENAPDAYVDTNGALRGYIVFKNTVEVCRDPAVWNQFRGPESYIVCEGEED